MLVPVELMAMAEYPTADLAEVPLDARIRDGPLDDK